MGTLRAIRFIDDTIDRIIRILFILVLLIGAYFIYDSWYIYHHANDTSMLKYKPTPDNPEIMKDLSDGVVAWLTIDGTNIDYPIMQGETNEAYLNTNPYGEFSLSGSIFLDARNSSDFSDPYSLVYGHHMEHKMMFGGLDLFQNQEYFDRHREGTLTTVGGKVYDFHVFAATETQTSTDEVFMVTECPGLPEWLEKNSDVFEKPSNSDWKNHIVGLSTCKTPDSIDRTCVFGWIEATDEKPTEDFK